MGNNALIKADSRVGRLRSTWQWYRERSPVVRITLPLGLALACVTGAWTVLNEGEYGVALVLVGLFLLFGIQAVRETAWSSDAKWGVSVVFILVALYSGAVIVVKQRGKPWTNLSLFTDEKVQFIPQPSPSPSPSNVITATPEPRKRKPEGLTEEEKWILRQLNSNKHAHVNPAQKDRGITKEELKSALTRKLSKRGLKFLVAQVHKRKASFVLTPEIEKEIRDIAVTHGNRDIRTLISAIRENSLPVPLSVSNEPTLHDQFLSYPTMIKIAPRSFVFAPPAGEYPIEIEARLTVHLEPFSKSYKELVVYIPPTGEMPFVLDHVITSWEKWAEQIEKLEAQNIKVVNLGFPLRPVVIFHASEVWDRRAEMLKQKGYTLIGPKSPTEKP